MKNIVRWSGVLAILLGFSSVAGAIGFDHKHSVNHEVFTKVLSNFDTKMRLDSGRSSEHWKDPVAWIFGGTLSEHRGDFHNPKGMLLITHSRVRKLISNHTYSHIAPVPEPGVYAMMIAGVGIVAAFVRRRRTV